MPKRNNGRRRGGNSSLLSSASRGPPNTATVLYQTTVNTTVSPTSITTGVLGIIANGRYAYRVSRATYEYVVTGPPRPAVAYSIMQISLLNYVPVAGALLTALAIGKPAIANSDSRSAIATVRNSAGNEFFTYQSGSDPILQLEDLGPGMTSGIVRVWIQQQPNALA